MRNKYFSGVLILLCANNFQSVAQNNYVVNTANSPIPNTNNTLVGPSAGNTTMTGGNNTFLGSSAGRVNSEGSANTFIGCFAGQYNTSGFANTNMGSNAGTYTTTGFLNAFIGNNAGQYNTTGFRNTFVGSNAGTTNTEGIDNTFLGSSVGNSNTTGSYNLFVGTVAGYSNTTGSQNTFVGTRAGYNNSTGNNNIIIGPNSGTAISTSDENVLIGYNAQAGDGKGGHNVIIGGEAGGGLWAGTSNTMIGHQASAESVALHHATAIGAGAHVTVSNAVVLGNQANVGIGTTAPTARLHISSGQLNESGFRLSDLTASSPTTQSTDQFLTVNEWGDVIKARYQLRINNANEWSDKVFAPNYQLRPLASVAAYIQENGHLPGVPSANEVIKEGVDLVKMNATLLEKVEELTLYLIQQQKRIEQLETQVRQAAKP